MLKACREKTYNLDVFFDTKSRKGKENARGNRDVATK